MNGKWIMLSALISILISCGSDSDGFCECLEKSSELDAVANQILLGNDGDQKSQDLMKIKEEQVQACKKFEMASGPEMREWQEECENQ